MSVAGEKSSFFARHEFLIRRLHSLSGLIPVGAYMVIHLLTNASILDGASLRGATTDGAATFQKSVFTIHGLGSMLPLIEWTFIFIPILFHAIIGLIIIPSGQDNTTAYPYKGNLRYTLQRATGIIAFFFIMWHVFHMHGWLHFDAWLSGVAQPLGGGQFRPYNAASTAATAIQNPIVTFIYVIGVLACVYHLANGIWTMGITWGVWTTPKSQARATKVCAVFGVALAVLSMATLWGFNTLDVRAAKPVEDRMYEAKKNAGDIKPDDHKRDLRHSSTESAAKD